MKPNDSNAAGSASATNNSTNTSGTPGSSLTNGGTGKNGGTNADLQQTGSIRTTSHENDDQQQALDGEDSNQQNPGKMFIGGLSWNTTAEGLRDYFSKFGEVNECMVMRDPTTKRARGFGFITFVEPSSVEKVLLDNDHELDGKKIDPKVAFPKRQQPKVVRTKKVFIGGLSSNTTLDEMKVYFQQFGKIEDAMLMFDKSTQRHRGFGFIVFTNEDVCEKVCEIHFHEINGKMVECKKAQPKEVMLPVQLNKSRAQAARNIYGMTPEQLLAYASYAQPRMPYNPTNLLYPSLFNGFSQTFGLAQSGRNSSNTGALNASTSGMFNPTTVQAVAQHQAYEAALAFANGNHDYYGHQQSIPNNYNNKM